MANGNERLVTELADLNHRFRNLCIDFVSDKDPEKYPEGTHGRAVAATRNELYGLAVEGVALLGQLEKGDDRMVVARRDLRW